MTVKSVEYCSSNTPPEYLTTTSTTTTDTINSTSTIEVFGDNQSAEQTDTTTATNPISNQTVWNMKGGNRISNENKVLLKKYLKDNNISITHEDVQKATRLLKQGSDKLGIDLNELSKQEKIFYAGLLIEMQRGNLTADEVMSISAEYGNDTVKAKVKELHLENGGGINEQKLNKYKVGMTKLAKMHSSMAFASAKQIYGANKEETTKLREKFLLKQQKATAKRAEEYMKSAIEALPENCTKDDAQKIITATGMEYGTTSANSFVTLAKVFNYSSDFISKMADIAQRVIETISNSVTKIVEWFFKTPRGHALKESYVEHREAYAETVHKVEVKTEEAKEAEKVATEAMENATVLKKEAEARIANLGLKNLSDEQYDKILKSKSHKTWLDLQYAKDAEKKAYWEAYDANSAKRLAENDCKWAFLDLACIKSQIWSAISAIRS